MIIKISRDLRFEEYWANGDELASIMGLDRKNGKRLISYSRDKKVFVHRFSNPVLVTDNYRIGKLEPAKRDSIFSLYTSWPKIFEYNGVSVTNNGKYLGVWSPSIDTVLFARALDILFRKRGDYTSAIEIGCGSGFLSKYILEKNKKLKSLLVTDINPHAIKSAMDNINDTRASFFSGNALEKIKGQKYDLLICNPPYVPRPKSIDDNAYEGINVLNYLLHNGQKYLKSGGALVVNISSLCKSMVLEQKPELPMKLLTKKTVPLKVNNILNNKGWLRYLTKNGLKKKYKNGYEYWQDLFIYCLTNGK